MKKLAIALLFVCVCATAPYAQAAAKNQGDLVIYNWSDYIPNDVLAQFSAETGIKVTYATYESNEAMYAKVKLLQGKTYDLICPTTYIIGQMITDGLLQPLDLSKVPNFKNVDRRLLGQSFDPQNEYSVPYMWGNYALIVNNRYAPKGSVTSWNDLLKPQFKGKVGLYDDMRITMGAALRATGSDVNSVSEDEIEKAYKWLEKLRPSIRVFDITAVKKALVTEEIIISAIWNGDGNLAIEENADLEYVYPKEGAVLSMDSFVITSGARNVDNAHAFINFMLRPEIALRCLQEYGYSAGNIETLKIMDKALAANRILNPIDEDLANAEMVGEVGPAQRLYNRYWQRLMAP